MKTLPAKLLGVVLAACLLGGAGARAEPGVYTSLRAEDCRTVEEDREGEFIRQVCPGTAGLTLEVSEGDLRQNVRVRRRGGPPADLDLIGTVSGGFSSLGPRAEWLTRRGVPFALILRFNASEDPARPERMTSYLVVSRVSAARTCVVAVVKPSARANGVARDLARQAGGLPCLRAPGGAAR